MNLSQIVMADIFMPPEWDRSFNHLVVDSRDVKRGDVFIARRGHCAHGEQHIEDAIARGAVAVLAESEQNFRCEWNSDGEAVPVFGVPHLTDVLPQWLHRRYATDSMNLIAVTGTNGKSSVTQYIAQLSAACGEPCGVLGTLGNGCWPNLKRSRNTTPDLSVILQNLENLQQQNVHRAALEVSSHGLSQQRVDGLVFDVAVLTNLTQDHLDYHGDMDDYFAAKRMLFTEYPLRVALINIDDDYGRKLATDAAVQAQILTIGQSADAMIRYQLLTLSPAGMIARLMTPWGNADIRLPLIGEFNLANACAAICALAVQGNDFTALCRAAETLQPVAGRMELYVKDKAPLAIIDFAHTPDALKNVLTALVPWQKKITCVFGCGGDRDRTKRPLMAAVANDYCGQIWMTDDNPRYENPEQIFKDALQNMPAVHQEHDRTKAIAAALAASEEHDIVLVAGKGHEDYQDILGVKHPYSDADVLTQLGYCKAGSTAGGSHDQ